MTHTKQTFHSHTKTLQADDILRLDQPQRIWEVQSGAVALFSIPVQNGQLHGARRYLFTIEAHESSLCFGIPSSNHCIIAVPVNNATLLEYDRTDLSEATGHLPIINWILALSSVFDRTSISFPIPEFDPSTPWLTQLTILDNLQQQFLDCLQELEQQTQQTEISQQVQAKEQLNHAAMSGAIADFVSLVEPQPDVPLSGDPLLIAAGAVGHAIGIPIQPAAASEDMQRVKDPLEAIARASRMRLRKVQLSERWWRNDCGPLLAYLRSDDSPVALLVNTKSNYEIYNPTTQQRIPLTDRSAKLLTPNAYMFYASFPDEKVTLKTLFQYALRGQAPEITNVLILGMLNALLGMVVPQVTGILIDTAIPDADRGLLLQLTIGLIAASFGVALFQLTQGINLGRFAIYSYANVQAAMWDRLLKLRLSFFREYPSGELLARINAIEQIRMKIGADKLDILAKSFFSLLNLGLLFIYSPALASIAAVVVFLTASFTSVAGHYKRQKSSQQEEIEGVISGMTIQLVSGISKLRTTAAENRAFAFWSKQYREQLRLTRDSQAIEDITTVFNTLQTNLTPILIFWMTASLVNQNQTGGLSTGTFLAFNAAFAVFITGVTSLSNNLVDLLEIGVLWDSARPIAEELPEIDLNKADPGRLSGYIRLDHVTFRYREDGPLNLDDVTVEAAPGEFIAFVGPSGSGKSTTLRMILGFDVPEQGTVYFDGQDLAGLDVAAVRRQLGVVLQNGRIGSETVFENISGGALITMEEAWDAARMAGFDQDIENMSMGMHTVISEGGTNLSGGQRQRLLIARALVLKPRIILFDEATSALDNRTQAIVSASLEKMKVTRVAIAHRLSTIRNADRIYVIAAGRIIQAGSYDELANQEGWFANLLNQQNKPKST